MSDNSRLLIVYHAPSELMKKILFYVLQGARCYTDAQITINDVSALEGTNDSMLHAAGYIFITPANIGYMSGALKHFFDINYNHALGKVQCRPFALIVHGNSDTTGACNSVHKIARGLDLRQAYTDLSIIGTLMPEHEQQCIDIGATLAAVVGDAVS